jgi:hypothetical protein
VAGEISAFVVGTDVVGGGPSSGVAGGALPGTWAVVTAAKPELASVSRQDYVIPQVRIETVP